MIAFISPSMTMVEALGKKGEVVCTTPRFLSHSQYIVSQMVGYSSSELSDIFRITPRIARGLKSRFELLLQGGGAAAVDSYDGVVYRHFKGGATDSQRGYLQQHLRISSLLYGLLRPMDLILPYRMEGFVELSQEGVKVERYWRDIQTQTLIDDVMAQGGVLLHLAARSEQRAYHWQRVKSAVRVIDFSFMVDKGDKLKQIVIYTKMARGEMIRYMMQHEVTDPEELKAFEWGGYQYCEELSTPSNWVFLLSNSH